MNRAFDFITSQPWLITPAGLESILAIAQRMGDPGALQEKLGARLDNTRRVTTRDGTAIIPITGPIFRHANLFTEVSGATSTDVLATDLRTALDNAYVKAIVLDINSPGGEVNGIHEMANMIYVARGRKPVRAYIGGIGASAAYWLASATSSITVDATALIGSIGVVMSYLDTTARDEKAGIRRIEIVSSTSPDKRSSPATEDGRARVQSVVDSIADVFVRSVARFMGVSVDKVLSDFGQGGVRVGADAVRAGMAHGLGSLEWVIAGKDPMPPLSSTPNNGSSGAPKADAWAGITERIYADRKAPQQIPTTPSAWDAVVTKLNSEQHS